MTRATQEYLDMLDDAALGAATPVQPRTLSPNDPAARFTGTNGEFHLAATVRNHRNLRKVRKLAKLIPRAPSPA